MAKTVEESVRGEDGNQLPVPQPPAKRLRLEQVFENTTFRIPVSEEQQEIARVPAVSKDIPVWTVKVSSVHAVPVPISRPVDEPLQFSAAKVKKRTKVDHRNNPRTVKPGAYYAHQLRHDPFGPFSSKHRGESVAGDFDDYMLLDPYESKKGRREEKARIERETKKMECENLSAWSTSLDSDEVFEKEEEIEEEQRKVEDEWNESLNQSRSS
ncbi:MAG: hypothetical protein GY847_29300, partial [Proteobacteria bacterium]|nr:hypothetical protein [Pseudomonadota bacterium]